MPAGDRTGPWGLGPRTGRGLGYCSGYRAPGFMYTGRGFGFGPGFGLGRGFGRGMGLRHGRGFWRPRFGRFLGYPYYPMTPFLYPFGSMPYAPFPPAYGRPYGPAYPWSQPPSSTEKQP
jgi:hypothetical protein